MSGKNKFKAIVSAIVLVLGFAYCSGLEIKNFRDVGNSSNFSAPDMCGIAGSGFLRHEIKRVENNLKKLEQDFKKKEREYRLKNLNVEIMDLERRKNKKFFNFWTPKLTPQEERKLDDLKSEKKNIESMLSKQKKA